MANQAGYRIRRWGGIPQWESFDIPVPGSDEVLVKVDACGVGLTVLNCINGDLGKGEDLLPRVPGHELVGRISQIGQNVSPDLIGRLVVAYFYLMCGSCESCTSGRESRCVSLGGFVGVHTDGGYSPWVVLHHRNVVPVPDNLDPVHATVIPDAVATAVHVVDRTDVGESDRVTVIGAGGGVGIHLIQVAAHRGATVAGCDVTEEKAAEIERLHAIPVRTDDIEDVDGRFFAGRSSTVVVDLVGSDESTRWAIGALEPGGVLVVLTTFPDRMSHFTPREVVLGELSIVGSRYASVAQVREAARLVAEGHVEPIVGRVVSPRQVLDLHHQIRSRGLIGRGALDWR